MADVQEFVVGRIEDFPPDSRCILELGGREIGIFNVKGDLYALQNQCPHALAPVCRGRLKGTMLPSEPGMLEYGMDGLVLRCPWHGWEFDIRTGETLFGVNNRRVAMYPVQVRDGDVIVEMRPRSRADAGEVSSRQPEAVAEASGVLGEETRHDVA